MNPPVNHEIILSIETATPVCSIAIHINGKLEGIREHFADKSHSQLLIPMIRELLKNAGIGFNELSAVAVSKGPGSYTGLRIGVSAAKGLCFAHDIPLIGVDTLLAIARQVIAAPGKGTGFVCPMLDARRMEVYTMLVGDDSNIIVPVHAAIIDENSFREYLKNQRIVFAGPGALKCKAVLGGHPNAVFMDGIEASAGTIGELAHKLFLEKSFEDTAAFEPFYLKEFQATIPRKRL
ncbi:MAG TPA: tRNA (adenosine(37)-N6)-threonylcarbamoyltransferase complex dimerization subunit type 1 TsaB [Cyclobacteriaceae bacterium]|nr:tRNA (adenosine(37)-N6)-threonylcarbamoyltransferase complex dimerization subunit type 1 TsaB [Cyclobacteriaceae bacterium]